MVLIRSVCKLLHVLLYMSYCIGFCKIITTNSIRLASQLWTLNPLLASLSIKYGLSSNESRESTAVRDNHFAKPCSLFGAWGRSFSSNNWWLNPIIVQTLKLAQLHVYVFIKCTSSAVGTALPSCACVCVPMCISSYTSVGAYLLSVGIEGVLVLWQVDTQQTHFRPRLGSAIASVSTSPKDEWIALGMQNNGTVSRCMWHLTNWVHSENAYCIYDLYVRHTHVWTCTPTHTASKHMHKTR